MDDVTGPWSAGAVLLLAAAAAGAALYRRRRRQAALRDMLAPSQWPVMARELVTPEEHALWLRLCDVFAEYRVMLKVPLVRYVATATLADSAAWHKRLSGVYCTFTVCNTEGVVIGCVDCLEPGYGNRAHCYFKESILGKCGIAYVMAETGKWPSAGTLRTAFIGDIQLGGPDMF